MFLSKLKFWNRDRTVSGDLQVVPEVTPPTEEFCEIIDRKGTLLRKTSFCREPFPDHSLLMWNVPTGLRASVVIAFDDLVGKEVMGAEMDPHAASLYLREGDPVIYRQIYTHFGRQDTIHLDAETMMLPPQSDVEPLPIPVGEAYIRRGHVLRFGNYERAHNNWIWDPLPSGPVGLFAIWLDDEYGHGFSEHLELVTAGNANIREGDQVLLHYYPESLWAGPVLMLDNVALKSRLQSAG